MSFVDDFFRAEPTTPFDVIATGDINDLPTVDLSGSATSLIRFTGAAPVVTGLVQAPARFGQRIHLRAVNAPLILANESASSLAPNRIVTGTGANVTIAIGGSAWLVYDVTSQRWSASGGAGGGNSFTGSCVLEQFGAKGDGTTDDSAAFDAASNAIRAGTYSSLALGSRTYLVNPTTSWPFGGSIFGVGSASRLKTTANRPILQVNDASGPNRAKTTTFANFMLEGSIGTTPANTLQDGIDIGYLGSDGSSRVIVSSVVAKNFAGTGFVTTSLDDAAFGPLFLGCMADGCWKGLVGASPGEAVGFRAINCTAWGAGLGGNFCLTGGFIRGNALGMYVTAGGNDGHGVVTGVSFLHNTTAVQTQAALTNGEFFTGCRFYEGSIIIGSNTRAVTFKACTLDLTSWTLNGKVRLLDCSFDDGYTNTLTSIAGGEVEIVNPRALKMSIPAWIGALTHKTYSFPSNADQTLSSQDSWAQVLDIQAGTITTARAITLGTRPPNKGNTVKVKNRTSYAVTVKWATGTGVAVASGATATIGADGTNAVDYSDGAGTAGTPTVDPVTLALNGFYQGSYAGSPWAGTASAGTSGSKSMSAGVAAGVGAAVDTYTPATFNGTTQYLTDATNAASAYISTTEYTISGVINPSAAPAAAGLIYNNPGLLVETGGNFGLVYSAAGLQVYHGSALVGTLPLGTGSWKSFDIKFTGGVLSMRLGNAAWTTFSGVAATGAIANPFRIGSNFNASALFAGSVMVLEMAPTALSDANLNGQYAFRQARYPSMGL